jgi:DNA modification methylase
MIIHGDCVAEMAKMPEASVDAVVCDPPYLLTFMGRSWDHAPTPAEGQAMHLRWAREALRVLKPGGHLLAFGGTRTYHRLTCAIEDAGFEIRDCLSWMYGSGFPKSLDVSKAIDKAAGAEREVIGPYQRPDGEPRNYERWNGGWGAEHGAGFDESKQAVGNTAPATPEAQQWQGWGTALKPAHEPIVLARKPLAGTVAGNVLEYGTGALNVDGCRIGYASEADKRLETRGVHVGGAYKHPAGDSFKKAENAVAPVNPAGRWPANVVLSHDSRCEQVGTRRVKSGTAGADARGFRTEYVGGEAKDAGLPAASYADADGLETVAAWRCVESCPVRLLDEQSGERPAGEPRLNRRGITTGTSIGGQGRYGTSEPHEAITGYGDSGGASRFFYTAKASSAERNAGLEGFEAKPVPVSVIQTQDRTSAGDELGGKQQSRQRNVHPTVKPIALMRWLVRLVTPPGGTVLDPFAGSGTTGIAAGLEGLNFVGIEREEEYVRIAEARIRWWGEHPEGLELSKGLEADRKRRAVADTGQLGFLDDV